MALATGSIERGKAADLVILSADPTRDVAALQAIVMVVREGRIYRRGESDARRPSNVGAGMRD